MKLSKKRAGLLLAIAGAASFASHVRAQDDSVYWFSDYREALQEAKRTQKPVFLEFRCEA